MNEYGNEGIVETVHELPIPNEFSNNPLKHRAIIFMALTNVGKLFLFCYSIKLIKL